MVRDIQKTKIMVEFLCNNISEVERKMNRVIEIAKYYGWEIFDSLGIADLLTGKRNFGIMVFGNGNDKRIVIFRIKHLNI